MENVGTSSGISPFGADSQPVQHVPRSGVGLRTLLSEPGSKQPERPATPFQPEGPGRAVRTLAQPVAHLFFTGRGKSVPTAVVDTTIFDDKSVDPLFFVGMHPAADRVGTPLAQQTGKSYLAG